MKKLAYIKYSYFSSNARLWRKLGAAGRLLRIKYKIPAWAYIPFASIIFGFWAMSGWFACIYMLFRNFRFDIHYMQSVIQYNRMDAQLANKYLDRQMEDYKKRLSYNYYSPRKRQSIEATFERLYTKYRLPEPTDTKHEALISGISDIKGSIDNNTENLVSIQTKIDPVVLYTERKRQEEEERKAHQSGRKTAVSIEQTLGGNFDDSQLDILEECINELRLFAEPVTPELLENLFACKLRVPVRISRNKNRLLAFFLSELSYKNYIVAEWQSICARNNLFMSFKGKILGQNDYSSAAFEAKENPPKEGDTIHKYIKQLKRH
ncbi:MAG: hypothetical protein LBS20_13270 [Prevotella sp.]|jgi:hypothetical protein|nr:hypothetical protein [Prevotella sp.]